MIGNKVGTATIERALTDSPLGSRWLARSAEAGQQVVVTVATFPPGSKDHLLPKLQSATPEYLQVKSPAVARLQSIRLKGNEIYLIHAFSEGETLVGRSASLAQPRSALHFHRLINQLLPVAEALDQLRAQNLQLRILSPWTVRVDPNQKAFIPCLSPIGAIPEFVNALVSSQPRLRQFLSNGPWPDLFSLTRTIECLLEPKRLDEYSQPGAAMYRPIGWLDEQANRLLALATESTSPGLGCAVLLNSLQQTRTYIEGSQSLVQRLSEPLLYEARQFSVYVELMGSSTAAEMVATSPTVAIEASPLRSSTLYLPPPLPVAHVDASAVKAQSATMPPTVRGTQASSVSPSLPQVNQDARNGWFWTVASVLVSLLLFTGIVFRSRLSGLLALSSTEANVAGPSKPASEQESSPDASVTTESLMLQMNEARRLAIDAGAEREKSAQWMDAEANYIKVNQRDHNMPWTEFVDLCQKVCTGFNESASAAKFSEDCKVAASNYERLKGFHSTGAPERVPAQTKSRLDTLEREGLEAQLSKNWEQAAKLYNAAISDLSQADIQSRIDAANALVQDNQIDKAVRLLSVRIGETDAGSNLDLLFNKLMASDKSLWLQIAKENHAQFKRLVPETESKFTLLYGSYIARALVRLERRDELQSLVTQLHRAIPKYQDHSENPVILFELMDSATVALLESHAYLQDKELASECISKMRSDSLLPPRYVAALSLGLGRVDDFMTACASMRSAQQALLELNCALEMAACVMKDLTLLDELSASRKSLPSLRALLSDVRLAENGMPPKYFDPAKLAKVTDVGDIHLMNAIRRMANCSSDSRFLEQLRQTAETLPTEAAQKAHIVGLVNLADRANVYRGQASNENARELLNARLAVVDEKFLMRDIAEQLSTSPELKTVPASEIRASLVRVSDLDFVDICCVLACETNATKLAELAPHRLPAKLSGTKTSGEMMLAESSQSTRAEIILRSQSNQTGKFEALLRAPDLSRWQLCNATVVNSSLKLEPTKYKNEGDALLQRDMILTFFDTGTMGASLSDDHFPQLSKFERPSPIDKSDGPTFIAAVETATYMQLLAPDGKVRSTKWRKSPNLLFHSDFKGELPKQPAPKSQVASSNLSENATYFQETHETVAMYAKLFNTASPPLVPVLPDAKQSDVIRIYFAPQALHKEFALRLGFTDEQTGQLAYSVAAKHKLNTAGGLGHVLICVDPTGMTHLQRMAVLERSFLRAFGLGIYGKPLFQVGSSLCDERPGIPSTGITELDKRFIRGLWGMPTNSNEAFLRQSYISQKALPLP